MAIVKTTKPPSSHVRLWELDCRMPKNDAFKLWCWRRCLQVPWTAREINPKGNSKGNQSWIFTGRTDAEAETPVFWSSDVNRWLTGKVPDAGKDWGQKEQQVSEDEMAGQHHQCSEHELGQTPGDSEGKGRLVCCSPWGSGDWTTTWIMYVTVHSIVTCSLPWHYC